MFKLEYFYVGSFSYANMFTNFSDIYIEKTLNLVVGQLSLYLYLRC